jgi:hypothetical protein
VQELPYSAETKTKRLLRILFLWHCSLSAGSGKQKVLLKKFQ